MDPILMLFGQQPRKLWQWTLKPEQRAWSRDNALALANCALLAYSDTGKIITDLSRQQFDTVTPCNSDQHVTDTQAYVAVRRDAAIVAFRGTEPTSLRDFGTDFEARQVPFESKFQIPGWGRIHEGWADGVAVVLAQVLAALQEHDDGVRPLWITGHSLGGALAMVAAALLANTGNHRLAGVYTFGQPRVGDTDFRTRYDQVLRAITFRCVNDRDLVPHVPPRELSRFEVALANPNASTIGQFAVSLIQQEITPDRYEHAGQLRLLLGGGAISDRPEDEAEREPAFLARPRTARSFFFELPAFFVESPALIKDHAPINFVTHDGYVERIEALP
jgi:triacylglycerol lipase